MDDSSTFYREQVGQAQQIMQPFVLRRLKSEVQVCSHLTSCQRTVPVSLIQVLHQLPSKHEHVEYCSLTETQQLLYDRAVQRARGELGGTTGEENVEFYVL